MMQPEDQAVKILAVIPAFNESERISGVIKACLLHLPVLVIDDGSVDDTSGVAKSLGAQVIRQEPNLGKGAALLRGFQYGLDNGYDAVITLDADGQHDPEEIPLFLEEFQNGSDLVIGRRDFGKMPFPRNFSNTIGTWMFSSALGRECPDNQSGYRLHSKRMMEASLESRETNFEFEVDIIVRCVAAGYKLAWVPIRTIYAGEHSHIRHMRHIWHFFRMVRQTRKIMRENRSKLSAN